MSIRPMYWFTRCTPGSGTDYHPLEDWKTGNQSSDAAARAPIASAGKLNKLAVYLTAAPGTSKSRQYTVMINGVAAALDLTISNAATSGTITTDVTISAQDLISVRQIATGTPAACDADIRVKFTPTTVDEFCYPVLDMGAANAVNRRKYLFNTDQNNNWRTSDNLSDTRSIAPFPGMITGIAVNLQNQPGVGKSLTYIIEKNGTEEATSSIVVADANNQAILTGLTISVSQYDQLTIKVKAATNSPADPGNVSHSVIFVPTTAGLFMLGYNDAGGISNVLTNYISHGGGSSTTEANVQFYCPDIMTWYDYAWVVSTAPVSGRNWVLTSRINTANGSMTVTLANAATTTGNSATTDALAAGDIIDLRIVPSGSPSGPGLNAGAFVFLIDVDASGTGNPSLSQLTGAAVAAQTQSASAADSLSQLSASVVGNTPPNASAAPNLSQLAALGANFIFENATGAVALPSLTALAAATHQQTAASNSVGLKNLSAVGSTNTEPNANGVFTLSPLTSESVSFVVVNVVAVGTGGNTLPRLIALARSATDQSIRIHIPLSKRRGVFIHSGFWPYERKAELMSAHNKNYNDTRMDIGIGTVDVNMNDPQLTADLMLKGGILVIESSRYNSWAGPITMVTQNRNNAITQIQALDWLALADGRLAPQSEHWQDAIGSGGIVRNLITIANMRSHTGIYIPNKFETGPSIVDLQTGGQSVKEALDEIHGRTNYEYWVTLDVTPSHIEGVLNWGKRQGVDTDLYLYSDMHFVDTTYKVDFSKAAHVQVSMGGFGSFLENRTAVATVIETIPQLPDTGNDIHSASLLARKSFGSLPVGQRTERMQREVMTSSPNEIGRVSYKNLVRPIAGHESADLIVNGLVDWHDLAVGNTFHYVDRVFGEQRVYRLRVVSIQPDDERVEAQLQTELVLG